MNDNFGFFSLPHEARPNDRSTSTEHMVTLFAWRLQAPPKDGIFKRNFLGRNMLLAFGQPRWDVWLHVLKIELVRMPGSTRCWPNPRNMLYPTMLR